MAQWRWMGGKCEIYSPLGMNFARREDGFIIPTSRERWWWRRCQCPRPGWLASSSSTSTQQTEKKRRNWNKCVRWNLNKFPRNDLKKASSSFGHKIGQRRSFQLTWMVRRNFWEAVEEDILLLLEMEKRKKKKTIGYFITQGNVNLHLLDLSAELRMKKKKKATAIFKRKRGLVRDPPVSLFLQPACFLSEYEWAFWANFCIGGYRVLLFLWTSQTARRPGRRSFSPAKCNHKLRVRKITAPLLFLLWWSFASPCPPSHKHIFRMGTASLRAPPLRHCRRSRRMVQGFIMEEDGCGWWRRKSLI